MIEQADTPAPPLLYRAVVFDMDGVVTRTADLHAAAWKELFDSYLAERLRRGKEGFPPFDPEADYLAHVDGKPRYEGVRAFLASRGIALPDGDPGDEPDRETMHGLGSHKDALFVQRLRAGRAQAYASTVALIEALRARGAKTALVTSSRHGREVLAAAAVDRLFDLVLDGLDAAELGLRGKPDPDIFLAAAKRLGAAPAESIVVEDAVAGVEAARRGHFGLVVGVDRGGNREALARYADIVVGDLGELSAEALDARLRARTARRAPEALAARAWHLEQEGFDAAREHGVESIFTVGNGYLGVRGALETPLPGAQADLFIAGVYDRKQPSLPYSELEFLAEERGGYAYSELVSAPFPFALEISVDGQRLDLAQGPWRELRRVLDLERGALRSRYLYEDDRGRRTRVETWRCASADDPHLLLQELSVTCENHQSLVQIDASMQDAALARDHPHLQPLATAPLPGVDLRAYSTRASGYTIALASRARLAAADQDRMLFQIPGKPGAALSLRRYVTIFTSRDGPEPVEAASAHVLGKDWADFERARTAHEARWTAFWSAADVACAGSPPTTQALRFNAYHLRIAADHDPRVSIGARTLSGRAYEGHVFWDVEVFMLPFFLHTAPDIARGLLLYRYHTLAGARARARELGFRGACYAWESTVTGADATPRRIVLKTSGREVPIYTGYEQVHVSADVALGVWRYWEATRDEEFMRGPGAEILLETARFWASRCERGPRHYHIRGVTGPDEYHHTVNDNAYTNWMARFNLEQALWVARWLRDEDRARWEALAAALAVGPEELGAWEEVVRELYLPQPGTDGVIEQFEGYFDRREYRLGETERLRPPLARLFEAEAINASQLIKQADVLMLPFVFPEAFSREVLAANYRYYEPRTDHGSSLSPSVHAALAARLGLHDDARRYWSQSLWLDLSNTMGNGSLGVHAACMGGTWQALVFGFLGVRFTEDGPMVDADAGQRLPEEWGEVTLKLVYRGREYPIEAVHPKEAR
jgi:beta-phosphoglucomutase family hydrolase